MDVVIALSSASGIGEPSFSKSQQQAFCRALACSLFIQKQLLRFPTLVAEVFDDKGLSGGSNSLTLDISSLTDEATVMRVLRLYRNQSMLRIACQDLAGVDVDTTLKQLSTLADGLINCAVDWAYQVICQRFGTPRDEVGREQKLMVIGMGKLGAHELNFSSDIDLIFCYPSTGETDGSRSISNEEFFTRVCRQVVKLLDKQTADGFVFRVDTRLRPFGDSGALVLNSDAMELYYQSHAREWERYAMVKARLITGSPDDKASLASMIRAFVFRRYLDYGVFDSIRVMKRQIEAELQRKGVEHNVKLGPGGIREIEFIGQAYQLIRGGRDTTLQVRGILDVLALLADKGHISTNAANELTADYNYLRRLENHLQEIDDKQTHELPTNERDQARLVLAMNTRDWAELLDKTHQVMARVHAYFEVLVDFSPTDQTSNAIDWLSIDETVLTQLLESKNIAASNAVSQDIIQFCHSYPVRQLQEKGRQYFMRLMPLLIDAMLLGGQHERTLSTFLKMLEKICNRSVYLVLLVENKSVFNQLIRLAKLSPWIITQVTQTPILLDELIDPASLYNPPSKEDLAVELNTMLAGVGGDDIEGQMDALRLFKQVNVLRVAAADLTDVIPLMVVSDKLTAIAEVIVEKVLTLCWQAACLQYGTPVNANSNVVSGFSVIGFGKMGGIELGFSSDLDVIFLHNDADIEELTTGDKAIPLSEFYMRLGRKVITFMTTRTYLGKLYEMDLRLRPNGNSGLLVTSESSFRNYQENKAWTWEHQALIRARFVAGCGELEAKFSAIREAVLAKPRDVAVLKDDVLDMRHKMRTSLLKTKAGCFDLKHGVGGIVDIEFIVQFGVLANASQHKVLLAHTDNIRLLLALQTIGFITNAQQQALQSAYQAYRQASHHASLAEGLMMIESNLLDDHIQCVSNIWNDIILNSPATK
ncbi:MAG TPA: bifunctional [glutamate--ammonia ligase]-adenylyl-L-tyrosine phosphorylase/[glutamate--ammonia-ligase] adenylyltransferase [Cycloclasticus sp.]|nr:bifunctional [glutamate--ammonia ligase]-adenylyl-L-tyrosine phosphorylase/[glutamate--ammonia-ligase] adenylyltransferase [Cycloclasticus sp.]